MFTKLLVTCVLALIGDGSAVNEPLGPLAHDTVVGGDIAPSTRRGNGTLPKKTDSKQPNEPDQKELKGSGKKESAPKLKGGATNKKKTHGFMAVHYEEPPVARNLTYELVARNTWDDFKARYSVDTSMMATLLDGARFDARRRAFGARTQGLLAGELHRAQLFGMCEGDPVNWACDKEMGYCLELYLPVAYFAHLHGCLGESAGYPGTEAFYFFNPDHVHLDPKKVPLNFHWKDFEPVHPLYREWERDRKNGLEPRGPGRTSRYPSYGFKWPPTKEFYHNDFLTRLGKPVAIVGGKHTTEWSGPPLNTFAEPKYLKPIIDTLLSHNYTVVYKRPGEKIGEDSPYQHMEDPGDYDFIRSVYRHEDVILWQEMEEDLLPLGSIEPPLTMKNVLMLSIYANSDLFVMTQGGNSVIASLFDGELFIYHAAGGECLEHNVPPLTDQYVYDRWNRHGGARMTVVNYHADLHRNLAAHLQEREYARIGI